MPDVRRCLDNGRALQELLYEAAPRYIKALKRERAKAAGGQASWRRVESGEPTDQFCRLGVDAPEAPFGAGATGHRRLFFDEHAEMIETIRGDLRQGSEERRHWP